MTKKFNYYLGATVSSWALAILVIAAELFPSFKDLLKGMFSHHWIGKAVITAVLFVIVSFLFRNRAPDDRASSETVAWYSVLGGLIIIFLFYLFELYQ